MASRDRHLQQLLDVSRQVIAASGHPRAAAAGARVFGSLDGSAGASGACVPARLEACDRALDAALGRLAAEPSPLPDLGAAFAAIEGGLAWYRRSNAEVLGQPFRDGHANAMLIGPGGLERREDVWVGATVMAPWIDYPVHDHPPEEVYIALSPGQWWNTEMDWTEPGPGGVIYNPRGILHAMRSHAHPMLALWFLPID